MLFHPQSTARCVVKGRSAWTSIGGSPWTMVVLVLTPAFLACGASHPPTKAEIAAKPAQSMHDCKFTVTGIAPLGDTPLAGSGVVVLKPKPAASWELDATDFTGAPVTFDIIRVDESMYTRNGPSELWKGGPVSPDDIPDAFFGDPLPIIDAFSGSNPVTYVGEEKIGGDAAWHIRTQDSVGTYDEWVRESDGVVSRLSLKAANTPSAVTIQCVGWNSGAVVAAPAPAAQACAALTSGDVQKLGFLSASWTGIWVARTGSDSGVEFTCGGGSIYSAILAIYPASKPSTVESVVAALRQDAAGQELGDETDRNVASYQGKSFDLTVRSTFKFSSTGFDCMRPDGTGCEAGLRMRVGAFAANGSVYVVYFASNADTFDAFVAAAAAILNSITIKH